MIEIKLPEPGKLAIIKFTVPNCPGCTRIAPFFEELKGKYHDRAEFYELDFKDNRKYGPIYKLSKMPCIVIQNSVTFECVSGVQHPDTYMSIINKLLGETDASESI